MGAFALSATPRVVYLSTPNQFSSPVKLALHRSLTFWSGILTIAFICWMWWDSSHFQSQAQLRHWMAVHGFSGVSLARTPYVTRGRSRTPLNTLIRFEVAPPPFYLRGGFRSGKSPASQPASFVPKLVTYRQSMKNYAKNYHPSDYWNLFIPHWLILLAVALPWTGMLVWRGRRRKSSYVPLNPPS